jgi:DNA-directed RNA polymerase specialized sigma24 family protein
MSELPPPGIGTTLPPLSEAEIRCEISSLTAGGRTRLIRIANYYGRISFEEPDELVHEAICRVLEGKRAWPRDLEKLGFLAGVIKSIAGDRRRAQERTIPLDEESEVREARRGLMDYEGTEARKIRAKLDEKRIMMRIMTLFDDDPIAQQVVIGMVDGARGEELERASGLSPTEYESKRKKIRRRIEKLKT